MEPGVHMDPAVNPAEEVSRKGAGLAIAQHHHEGGRTVQALIQKQHLATLLNAQVGCISTLLMYPRNNSRLRVKGFRKIGRLSYYRVQTKLQLWDEKI